MMMRQTTALGDGSVESMTPASIDHEIEKAGWLNKKSRKHWGPDDRMVEFAKIEDLTDKQRAERDNLMKVL